MTKTYKPRKPKKKMPEMSRRDKIYKRKRSTAEKVMLVMGILIAISMLMSLVVNLANSHGGF